MRQFILLSIIISSIVILGGCKKPEPTTKQADPTKTQSSSKPAEPTGNQNQPPMKAAQSEAPTSLPKAAATGDLKLVQDFIQKGSMVDERDESNGYTPLIWASFRGKTDVVSFLLEKGADVNAKDKDQFTALHRAVFMNHIEVVKILIEKGGDVNAKATQDITPLAIAQKMEKKEVAELLISHGAK